MEEAYNFGKKQSQIGVFHVFFFLIVIQWYLTAQCLPSTRGALIRWKHFMKALQDRNILHTEIH